ncbi:aliphatic sulfonate ABC transporter substrate-binding protein [Deinococcus sonorensis]|uniref:Aliphatic sulfonate ABC transporter substrate-binding protein n=2 Tax=Deinococcus sonorensis TaxID=309891 RepID=A0ABV8Y5R4_9DEIO
MPRPLVSTLLTASLLTLTSASAVNFNIGYQKGGLPALLKARGILDAAKAQGITFTWSLFTAGPPLLEATSAGAVDFGGVGDAPGVFALAGGADLKYVAVTQSHSDKGEAILVPPGSSIKTVADLKGKRIGVARGSSAHYFLYNALKAAGLKLSDVQVVPLLPPDARPAFEGGNIDAWAIWDPYLTVALQGTQARVLRDHTGLPLSNGYYLTNSRVLKDPEKKRALQYLLNALYDTAGWANHNEAAVVDQLSADLGIPKSVLSVTVKKSLPFNIRSFTALDNRPLQQLGNAFADIGVLPSAPKLGTNTYASLPKFQGLDALKVSGGNK